MSSVAISTIALTPVGALQDNNGGIPVMNIIGFSIVGATFLVLTLWLAIRSHRKRSARRHQGQLGAAFLSVCGLVKDELTHFEDYPSLCVMITLDIESIKPLKLVSRQTPLFSRNNLSSQVVFPIKAHLKPSSEQFRAERHYITHHFLPDNTPKPFSPTVHTSTFSSSALISEWPVVARNSDASSRVSRFSIFSAASSVNETTVSTTSGGSIGHAIRKVRRAFDPILPDELLIALGESLIILQSFDDGWCVVGREGGMLTSQPKGLFSYDGASPTSGGGAINLGMVPAWCFLKPVKGLRAERPARSSSLSMTIQMDGSGVNQNDTISWSNI